MNDIDSGKTLALAGSLGKPMLWMAALMAIPITGSIVALTVGHVRGIHLPTGLIYLVPFFLALLLLVVAWSLLRVRVRVDQGSLIVNTGLGTSRMALSDLRAHGVRVVDLGEHRELKPALKLGGTVLPGFSGGWFRLRNGETAVCLLLNRTRVCYLRNDAEKRSLLLSLAEPEKLRALLER